jgi:glucokinase
VRVGIPDPGTRGFAQLIGNAVVTIPSSLDGPLVSAELETVAGGPGLVARYNACTGGGLTRGEDVFRRAAEGDGAAVAVIEELAGMVGSILALLVNVHDPQAVVVGGGLGSVGGRYWSTLVRRARECIWAAEARELPILPASLGEDAGVVGAGLLALDASVSHVASP